VPKGKLIIFRYEGDARSDETFVDLLDEREIPALGDIVVVRDEQWRVLEIQTQELVSPPPSLPAYRVFLTKVSLPN